jgi:hypothetical protein
VRRTPNGIGLTMSGFAVAVACAKARRAEGNAVVVARKNRRAA